MSEEPLFYDDDGESDSGTEAFVGEEDAGDGLDLISQFLSDDALKELAGTDDLESVTYLQIRVDSEAITMRDLGARLPRMTELKLNNSNVPSVRDLGTSFANLQVLWLSRSNVKELQGLGAFPCLKELYLSFNDIQDLSPIGDCEALLILDLEGNNISDRGEVDFLSTCSELHALTLDGNPIALDASYRRDVIAALPQLQTLDDVPVADLESLSASAQLAASPARLPLPPELEGIGDIVPLDLTQLLTHAGMDASEIIHPEEKPEESSILEELEMVQRGIKYGKVGCDDPNFVTSEELADVSRRPGTARSRRPMSASLVPSARPLSGGSRPASARRPGSASVIMASMLAARPATSYGRPAPLLRPSTSYGRGSQQDAEEHSNSRGIGGFGEASSDLTFGTEEVFCGNPAMALRSRKSESTASRRETPTPRASLTKEELLEELKRWKLETATIATMMDPAEDLPAIRAGDVIGGGADVERMVLDEEDDAAAPGINGRPRASSRGSGRRKVVATNRSFEKIDDRSTHVVASVLS